VQLLVNGLPGHVVTDDAEPTLTLQLQNTERFDAVRLAVTGTAGDPLWDSGMLPFDSPHVRYAGAPLPPKTVLAVGVTAYRQGQAVGGCSATFETGFLGTPWDAEWIEPEQEAAIREKEVTMHDIFTPHDDDFGGQERLRPCRELSKTFTCGGRPKKARLYATAHGLYELSLNGQAAGRNRLAPETSSYHDRLYYQTYDVAGLLREGDNEITVTLADGWWIGRIGLSGDSCQYGDRLGFLMQLEWTEDGGQARQLCSDASFQSRRSYIDYADLFIGERHDYTAADRPWGSVTTADFGTANLVAQPTPPVVEWERIEAKRLFAAPNGELVADFGKCLAGVAEVTVRVPGHSEVELDFSEVLDEEGNFYRNIMGRNKDQHDVFVCAEGETTFRPRFTYHGFRYVRIGGVAREHIVSMTACALGTKLEDAGHFTCSDERLDSLQRNIRQSERSNMFSVPTDCPQREKMGWTGDILAFAKTGCFNYDLYSFLAGWLADVRAEQREDGEVPNVVPAYPAQDRMERAMKGYNTSAAWGDACVLVPHDLYQVYGDKRILRDNLAMMEGWLGFIARAAAQEPEGFDRLTPEQRARNPYLWNKGQHFGDWLTPSFAGDHQRIMAGTAATFEIVASCYYAITMRTLLAVLDALLEDGSDEELSRKKEHFEALYSKIKQAVREEYVSEDGVVRGDLMGLYVMVLHAQIVDGDLRDKVARRLVRLSKRTGIASIRASSPRPTFWTCSATPVTETRRTSCCSRQQVPRGSTWSRTAPPASGRTGKLSLQTARSPCRLSTTMRWAASATGSIATSVASA
jgi:alpha-L-rhamnosidase